MLKTAVNVRIEYKKSQGTFSNEPLNNTNWAEATRLTGSLFALRDGERQPKTNGWSSNIACRRPPETGSVNRSASWFTNRRRPGDAGPGFNYRSH